MKYNFICFAIGVLFGTYLGLVYCTAVLNCNPIPVPVATGKDLKKEIVKFETGYANSFDTLKKKSEKLAFELTATKSELQKAKQRSAVLQERVYNLLDSQFEKQQSDETTSTTPCDTLATTVENLIQAVSQKDTLYEQTIGNLEAQVNIKDTTIALKDAQYTDLKSAFLKSIDSQEVLAAQNKQLSKEYKKQKVKSKLLSTILFALSGAAATYFIHH